MRVFPVLLLASVALPAHAQTLAQIRSVTLSTAGLAMIEAEGALGTEGLRLPVRRADIDDFLKSLRLSDPEGGVPMLSMTGPGGMQDTFDALPFDAAALGDLRALLGAMTGAPVRAERRGTVLEGAVMGTRAVPCDGDGQTGCAALTLRDTDGRLRQIALDEALELEFTDSADRDAIGRGLEALRANARALVLDVVLTSSNNTERDVAIGWLQPAPMWKTAWRAEDGPDGITLTGWAVLENTTGQDWNDVSLTLATGATQALQVQLYDRLQAARKFAEPAYAPVLAAPMARSSMMMESAMDLAPVEMDDGAAFSRFTLSTPVTLRAGEMISLPFLNEKLEDARLTLYRGGSHELHPMLAVEFTNPLPLRLPAGVVTVYEAGRGHAGDAMIPELVPGATQVIEFARDTALDVRETVDESNRVQSARIVDGVLVAEDRIERRSTYRIEGAPERATVLTIAHPMRHGWEMVTQGGRAALTETRFEVDVPQDQITEFAVLESRVVEQRVALLSLDFETMGAWSARLDDPAIREILSAMQDLRAEEAALHREMAQLQAQEGQLIVDQERLVGLIVQLGDDSPATRERRGRVDAIEAELMAARAARATAETRINEIDAELRALLR